MPRRLPLVLLAAVVSVACGRGSSGSEAETGTVAGTVLLGPMCPVQIEESPCPDEPLAGVTVRAMFEEDLVVASTRSDASGNFSLDLAPGTYTLLAVPDDDPARSAKPTRVTVTAGETIQIDVAVDSGIR